MSHISSPKDDRTQLILASTSKYRRELLDRLGVQYIAAAPSYDESTDRELFSRVTPLEFAKTLAQKKAESLVAHCRADQFILAADQIAITNSPDGRSELLCKPETTENAIAQLQRLRGRRHNLLTAVVLYSCATGQCEFAIDHHEMHMRDASDGFMRHYVETYQPLDCVGSYRIEDAGIGLFDKIVGADFTGIIGLPLLAVARLLRQHRLLADP